MRRMIQVNGRKSRIYHSIQNDGKENQMKDIIAGKWKQLRGSVKEKWGRLTDNEVDEIGGRADRKTSGTLRVFTGRSRE